MTDVDSVFAGMDNGNRLLVYVEDIDRFLHVSVAMASEYQVDASCMGHQMIVVISFQNLIA